MKLYDEEELRKKNEKSKKAKNIVLVSIIITFILIVVLMITIYYLIYNPDKITITLNGTEDVELENMMITKVSDEGNTIMYFPIRNIASKFGYNSNNGDYGVNVENPTNCYIESENEVAIFTENSNIIYKIDKSATSNRTDSEYEEVKVNNPVIKENDMLYVETDGLAKSFNLYIDTNKQKKRVSINTLNNLVLSVKKIVENNKLGKLDEKFVNQKAILDNMMVIESEFDRKKGVRNCSTNEEILGFQFDDITYIPEKKFFLIKKDGKVGIIDKEKVLRIKPQYDKLTLIDSQNGLYLAEDGLSCGVLDENGNTKIYLEYNKIGVDINEYRDNGLKNGYVLLDNIIPVKKDDKWYFFKIQKQQNAEGTNVIQCIQMEMGNFEAIGCKSKNARGTVSNLMVIPEYNVILVQMHGKFGFITGDGKPASGLIYTDAYIETSLGVKDYYVIDSNGNKIRVIDEFEKNGITKVK